jgi:hypothetical protein
LCIFLCFTLQGGCGKKKNTPPTTVDTRTQEMRWWFMDCQPTGIIDYSVTIKTRNASGGGTPVTGIPTQYWSDNASNPWYKTITVPINGIFYIEMTAIGRVCTQYCCVSICWDSPGQQGKPRWYGESDPLDQFSDYYVPLKHVACICCP